MRKVGYVAVDQGARLTLAALASRVDGTWLRNASGDHDDWAHALRTRGVELLVCGTSDSAQGRDAEAAARAAAHALRTPTVVVEDFPGNFPPMPATPPRLACVESEFAAVLARSKMPGLAVHVGPAPRYDALRRDLRALRATEARRVDNAVLWIGQPETADGLLTLAALLPALQARRAKLWFRAHPRDGGYAAGAYAEIFARAGESIEDMTRSLLDECLRRRPRLAITQFSSAAVEAGFWGIPSLSVLLPNAGAGTLARKRGYSVPPWCEEGAAFLVARHGDLDEILERALRSAEARRNVMQAFDRYFRVTEEGTPALINLLYNQGLL